MPQRDLFNRSLDAGRDVSQWTQDRLESLVRELATAAEEQASQAQQLIQEVVERSRANTEQLIETLDRELRNQIRAIGVATKADIERLEERVDQLRGRRAPEPSTRADERAGAARPAAKRAASPRKKAAGGRAAAQKAPAKKASAKKAASTRAAAKKASAKKAASTRAAAKKAPAKKVASRAKKASGVRAAKKASARRAG